MFKKNSVYPGIDKQKTKLISRSMDSQRKESVGVGFMHKDGSNSKKNKCFELECSVLNKDMFVDEYNFRLNRYALIYVIRGRGEYIDLNGNRYPLEAGSVFQRHPDVLHSTLIDSKSNWAECFIDFGSNLYNVLVAYKVIDKNHFVYKITPDTMIELANYDIMLRLENCSEFELPSVVTDIISFLTKIIQRCTIVKENEMDRLIEQSCLIFSSNIAERIELKQYCRKLGIGYENFRKIFRGKIGVSPRKYIVNRRMDSACQLLRMSQLSIKEIAIKLGYSSQYEFSAQFKKYLKISPKNYRQ